VAFGLSFLRNTDRSIYDGEDVVYGQYLHGVKYDLVHAAAVLVAVFKSVISVAARGGPQIPSEYRLVIIRR
jgi:hypothetical protein